MMQNHRTRQYFVVVLVVAVGLILAKPWSVSQIGLSIGAQVCLFGVVACLVKCLAWGYVARLLAVCVLVLFAMFVSIAVELTIFSETTGTEIAAIVGFGLVLALFYAVLVPLAVSRPARQVAWSDDVSIYFSSRRSSTWIGVVLLCVGTYVGVYFTFGSIVYPFVERYYLAGELGLTLPDVEAVLVVQCIRGLIYVLAIWMFIIGSQASRPQTAVLTGIALFVLGGFVPLAGSVDWPTELRIFHGIEILFQNFTAGYIICWLLWVPKR